MLLFDVSLSLTGYDRVKIIIVLTTEIFGS